MLDEKLKKQDEVTDIWKCYQRGISYQSKIGIRENIPKFVDFYEGRQWPAPTENTKNLPRPVANIVKMICRNKKSALLSVPTRLVFKADSKDADATLFTHFAEYIQKEMRQKQHDKIAVSDGVVKGSYFYHYYWDPEAIGLGGQIEGGMRCENIDPLDIFFENPRELDEQKQKWIIISSRVSVDSVRARADKGVELDLIVADNADDNPYKEQEQDESELCTVLTKYFRQNGMVYCEQATKKVVFKKAWHIIPNSVDAVNEEIAPKVRELYPIVAGYYEKREKCIYGLSEVEGLIPNQKAINFHLAMSLLNAQEMAWGKYVAMPNALKGQKISNVPGQVLIDYSGTGNGIKKMTEQAIHNIPLDIVNVIAELTRSTTGATEIMSGELPKAGMSGAAIAQLQAQAQQPIEELRDSFWLVKEKQGLVLAQFFKHFYYFDKHFTYEKQIEGKATTEDASDIFNSSKYNGVNFSVVVEATQGTRSSVVSDVAMLDSLLSSGAIDVLEYLTAYPDSAIGNKNELIRILQEKEKTQLAMLTSQNDELQAQLGKYVALIEKQKEVIDKILPIIQENNKLKEALVSLRNEYSGKINDANNKLLKLEDMYKRANTDATAFAEEILKNQNMQVDAQNASVVSA